MRRAVAAVLLLLGALGCSGPADPRPSVLLVIIDTARTDRFGCYGSTTVRTPAIDRLAGRGVLFENAISQAASTLPAVSTILTGLYPYRHQVRADDMNLDERFRTVAEEMRDAGYRTGAVVGSAVLDAGRNLTRGFDAYDDRFPERVEVYEPALRRAGGGSGPPRQRRAGVVTDRALAWLDRSDGPFFLLAHYFDPHSPYDPPPPFDGEYAGRPYDGEIAYADREVGRLLAGLKARDLEGRTLVVLVGDHGESLGDHGEPEHGFFVYDCATRVPLIVAFPGVFPGGGRLEEVVRSVDLLPTILDLAGRKIPPGIDGRSLAPGLRGEGGFPSVPAYSEAFGGYFSYGWSPTRSIRTAKWKYVEAPRKELYYLPDDPDELNNLYDSEGATARRLEEEMARHHRNESLVETVGANAGGIGGEQRRRLEALGYLSGEGAAPRDSFAGLPDPKTAVAEFRRRREAKYLTYEGQSFLVEGKGPEAAERFRKALDLFPEHLPARKGLGAVHLAAGGFREAEKSFRRVMEEDPADGAARVDLAIALNNQGRFQEAIELLANRPDSVPKDPRADRVLHALLDARARGRPLTIR